MNLKYLNRMMTRMSGLMILALIAGLVVTAPLSAARRVYESQQPLEQTVARMLDQMAADKMKFTVRKVYDRKNDGKEGFLLFMPTRGSLCEITFRADVANPKRSLIMVFAQDSRDEQLFHGFFTRSMGLSELGVNEDFDDSNPWPIPTR